MQESNFVCSPSSSFHLGAWIRDAGIQLRFAALLPAFLGCLFTPPSFTQGATGYDWLLFCFNFFIYEVRLLAPANDALVFLVLRECCHLIGQYITGSFNKMMQCVLTRSYNFRITNTGKDRLKLPENNIGRSSEKTQSYNTKPLRKTWPVYIVKAIQRIP